MPLPNVKVVTTHLEVEQIEMLNRLAAQRRLPKAQVIRDLLDRGYQDWLKEEARKLLKQDEGAA